MELSTSDLVGLMVAARSDEATTERLKQLQDMLAKIEASNAEGRQLVEEMRARNADASRANAAAEVTYGKAAAAQREHLAKEQNLAKVQAAIQAEKDAWEQIRQQVDAEQKATTAQLLKREKSIDGRESAATSREVDVMAREDAANALAASALAKIDALRAALDAVAPPAPKPKKDAA